MTPPRCRTVTDFFAGPAPASAFRWALLRPRGDVHNAGTLRTTGSFTPPPVQTGGEVQASPEWCRNLRQVFAS